MNFDPENFLPAPSGTTLYNQAIGMHSVDGCSIAGGNWTDSCPGTMEIEYDTVSDLLSLENHWLVISAEVTVAPDGDHDDGSKDYAEFTEIAVRVYVGCASNPTASGCQPSLKVFAKQLEPLRSGLAVHSVHYKDNPIDFTASTPSSGLPVSHYACQSGCTDILVSLIDPTTKKAPNPPATVKVALGLIKMGSQQVSNAREITPPSFGDGTLCETDPDGDDITCGTTLSGLTTDVKGQVTLRYWAPGVLAEATTILSVTATCSSCEASQGKSRTTLAEKPDEIYQKSEDLSGDDASELAEWADGPSGFNATVENSIHAYDILKVGLETLKTAEVLAHHAAHSFEDAEPLVIIPDVALKINEAFEAQGMFALFLDDSGLSPFGIGADPFEASADGTPSASFVHELMSQLAIPSFLRAGNGGFWWAAANDIRHVLLTTSQPTFDTYKWSLSTQVYEVSHCDPSAGKCGPGYGNAPGSAAVINPGIEPNLVIELSLVHAGVSVEDAGFVIPYDALAWATTQPNLQGVIQDS
jgi:hypothetical protein